GVATCGSGQVVGTSAGIDGLRWHRRWSLPGYVHEIEELAHIHGCGITFSQVGQAKASLNHLQDGSGISYRVRHIVRLSKRRHDHVGNAEAVAGEIARWIGRV